MMSQWNPYKQAFVFQVLESLLGSAVARKCSVLQIHRGKVPSMPNWMSPLFKVRGEPVIPSIFLWLKNFPRHRASAYRLQLHSRKKKSLPYQMHYKVQKHLRLYNSHNMVPQIKSQEETQQWDWALEPAVSLSKSNKKKKRQKSRCLLCESLFNESVFPATTLLISLVTSFSPFPFINFAISPPLLFHFLFLSSYFYSCFHSAYISPCTSSTSQTSLTSASFPFCLFRKCFFHGSIRVW